MTNAAIFILHTWRLLTKKEAQLTNFGHARACNGNAENRTRSFHFYSCGELIVFRLPRVPLLPALTVEIK